jgi:anti-sigma regulatory factor (Ser/Thr protein kinase)
LCNYFQSYEREKLSFLIETLRGAAILLPVTFLCSRFGLTGFWWLFPITEGVSFIITMIVIAIINKHGKPADTITEDRIFRRTILSTSNDIGSASADLEEFCEKWEANMRQQYTVMMTVEELGLTILQHGFEGRDDGYIQITVIALENGDFELHLRDDARSFDPFSLETARVQSDDDAAGIDSIGVLMIKKRSKEFHYRQYQGFNTLIVKI